MKVEAKCSILQLTSTLPLNFPPKRLEPGNLHTNDGVSVVFNDGVSVVFNDGVSVYSLDGVSGTYVSCFGY